MPPFIHYAAAFPGFGLQPACCLSSPIVPVDRPTSTGQPRWEINTSLCDPHCLTGIFGNEVFAKNITLLRRQVPRLRRQGYRRWRLCRKRHVAPSENGEEIEKV